MRRGKKTNQELKLYNNIKAFRGEKKKSIRDAPLGFLVGEGTIMEASPFADEVTDLV